MNFSSLNSSYKCWLLQQLLPDQMRNKDNVSEWCSMPGIKPGWDTLKLTYVPPRNCDRFFSIEREIQSVRVLKQPSCSEYELVLKLLFTLGMKVAACENTRSAMMWSEMTPGHAVKIEKTTENKTQRNENSMWWPPGYRYKSSIPCAKKVVVLKSFVIELLWYKRHLRNVWTRFQDACGCRGRSKAKGKGCNDAVPRDASVTTKGRKNRMWNQPLNLRKSQMGAPGNYHAFKSPKGSCLVPLQT